MVKNLSDTLLPGYTHVANMFAKLHQSGKKIAFVAGNFNIIHPGHQRLLRFAADCAEILVVGVYHDKNPGVLVPQQLRLESIAALSYVHHAFIIESELTPLLANLRPHFVIKGKEHENSINSEQKIIQTYGGKLIFSSGESTFSSIDLLRGDIAAINSAIITKPVDFIQRHHFSRESMLQAVASMGALKICVIGDTIVDEYISCTPLGMSQEDPTIVVNPVYTERYVGGAAIVAAHARGMKADVHFISVLGVDSTAKYVEEKMATYGVKTHFLTDASRPTTVKQRFRAGGKTLLRVNKLKSHSIAKMLIDEHLPEIFATVASCDLLIFADFSYGCLPQALIEPLVAYCSSNNIPMVADSQSSSQMGDIARFKGMEFITPTEREARLALQDYESGLVVLAEKLLNRSEAKNVIITLGEEGVMVQVGSQQKGELNTDKLPAFNSSPKDVAGAGDSLLVVAALARVSGCSLWESVYLGSLAAACQVSRIGNLPLTSQELNRELKSMTSLP